MDSKPVKVSRLLAFAAITALTACGGGGGSASAPAVKTAPTSAPITSGTGLAPASFSIKIPAASSSSISRRTQTVNAATTNMTFTLLKTTSTVAPTPAPANFDISAASPLCAAVAGGGRTCTIGVSAPIGSDIYSVQTFDAGGNKLGSSAVNLTVLQNVANSATISLGGTIAAVVATSLSPIGPIELDNTGGQGPKSTRVLIIGIDSSGNVILTPDTFSSPVNLIFSNVFPEFGAPTSSTVRRTRGVAIAPTVQASVTYASGAAPASITDVTTTALPVTSPGDIVTVTALAPGPPIEEDNLALLAFVGAIPATLPVLDPFAGGTPTALSLVPFIVLAAPPVTPVITWSNLSATRQFNSAEPSYQFLSPTDAQANLGITDSSGATTMSVTLVNVAPTNNCPSLLTGPTFPQGLSLAAGATLSVLIAPNGTGSGTCILRATDTVGNTAAIEIFINNVSGSIQ
jgi:hypothetical protein